MLNTLPANKRVVISNAGANLASALVDRLTPEHIVSVLPDDALANRDRLAGIATSADIIVHVVSGSGFDRATRGTFDLLSTGFTGRFILVSSLHLFGGYDPALLVDESFAPRPTTDERDLIPYLAEVTLREVGRVRPIEGVILRLGEVVDPRVHLETHGTPWDLHIEDAVQGVVCAISTIFDPPDRAGSLYTFHIVDGGSGSQIPLGAAGDPRFGYIPRFRMTDNMTPERAPVGVMHNASSSNTPAQRITMYGAGGPIGSAASAFLAGDASLRLTDVRSIDDLIAGKPQSPGAPMLTRMTPPHEHRVVDITDPDQAAAAAKGAHALVNCTVIRHDPVGAFDVNVGGALNVMRAAVAHGIRRVVQTGPLFTSLPHPFGYSAEFDLSDDLPPRPGDRLYFLTKYLGQEICRIFAEEHGMSVPELLFDEFRLPTSPAERARVSHPLIVSWNDAARAIVAAVQVPSLPRAFEPFHILADLPQGKYSNRKAKALLGWQPRDDLSRYSMRKSAP